MSGQENGNLGQSQVLPEESGFLSATLIQAVPAGEAQIPILLSGSFLADSKFANYTDILLHPQDRRVLVLIVDGETSEVLLCEFDFDGYAIRLWPGTYLLYAFILDPEDNELLGFGYPASPGLDDPNPCILQGEGPLNIDFAVFDSESQDGLSPGLLQDASSVADQTTIVGNLNSRVYHSLDCSAVQRMSPSNLILFRTSGEAEEAGFAPCSLCGAPQDGDLWAPYEEHPEHSNVLASEEEGNWVPAPGYTWVTNRQGDLRVVWVPGKEHSEHSNVFSSEEEGSWAPAPGYTWVTERNTDFRVKKSS